MDCRPGNKPPEGTLAGGRALRIVQWNIERGYELPGIIEQLRTLDADVLLLQEIDVGCDRSGGLDTGARLPCPLFPLLVLTALRSQRGRRT